MSVVGLAAFLGWIGLVFWSRRIGARHPESSSWRRLWLVPVASLVAQALGLLGTVAWLAYSFSEPVLARAPAAERASALARGIANAMNLTVFGLVAGATLLVMAVPLAVVGHLRAPRT